MSDPPSGRGFIPRGRARGRGRVLGSGPPGPSTSSLSQFGDPSAGTESPQQPQDIPPVTPQQTTPATPQEGAPVGETARQPADVQAASFNDAERHEKMLRSRDYLRTRPKDLLDKRGSSGTRLTLVGNYFVVELLNQADWRFYQHHVVISPEVDALRARRSVLWALKDQLPPFLFDGGAMLFAPNKVDPDPMNLTCQVTLQGVTEEYKVTVQYTNEMEWNAPGVIQFYNVLVRKSLRALNLTQIGRYYFDANSRVSLRQFGLELWFGTKTSMFPYENSVLLNMEMTNKIVRTDSVLSLMREKQAQFRDKNDLHRAIEAEVVGATVITMYNNRTYKIESIEWDRRVTDTFETKNGPITFVNYYAARADTRITIMGQPLLRARTSVHNPREILLVPELCNLTGLTEEMKTNYQLTGALKQHLFAEPSKRVSQLRGFMSRLIQNQELTNDMVKWGASYPANTNMVQVPARQLPAETIFFGGNRPFTDPANPSDWTKAFRGEKLYKTVPLRAWVIVATSRDSQHLDLFVTNLQKVANPLNFIIPRPTVKIVSGNRPMDFKRAIDDAFAEFRGNIDLIMVILPNNSLQVYSEVKKQCAVDYGIPSQCVLSKNVAKANLSVCTKIAIQMSVKLGAEPWTVKNPLEKSGTMIVGFDAYHAGQEGQGRKSVGAMVASMNPTLSRYTSQVQMCQISEVNRRVGGTLAILAKKYMEVNGVLPKRIIFYRDGVGEGQLSEVADTEISAIEESLGELYKSKKVDFPKLTFVVVSKRINARFMSRHGPDYRNPLPGTVVDDVVTLPERYDFYLISQQARQGTVSPTSYNVIRDDSDGILTPDRLQILTYKMCHLYYNWSGTVAVPAVCQYAHKLAFLTGTSINKPAHSNLGDLLHFL